MPEMFQPTSEDALCTSVNASDDDTLSFAELEEIVKGMTKMEDKILIEDAADLESVEALLDGLEDIIEDEIVEVEEDVLEPLEPEVLEAIEDAGQADGVEPEVLDAADESILEMEIAKEEVYAAAETGPEVVDEPVAAVTAAKPKASKAPKAPSVVRDLSALPDAVFTLTVDTPPNKAAVIAARPGAKKVAEKFDNVFVSLAANRAPNVYTVKAFNALVEKSTMTTGDFVAAFKADGYTEGTARSQAGQIMALFDVLGIAKRKGNSLTLNEESAVAAKLIEIPGVISS